MKSGGKSVAQTFLQTLTSPASGSSLGGFIVPISHTTTSNEKSHLFRKQVQEEQRRQIETKRKMLEDNASTELEIEKSIVKLDVERAEKDRLRRFERKQNNV